MINFKSFEKLNWLTLIAVIAWLVYEAYHTNVETPVELENIKVEEIDTSHDIKVLESLRSRIKVP